MHWGRASVRTKFGHIRTALLEVARLPFRIGTGWEWGCSEATGGGGIGDGKGPEGIEGWAAGEWWGLDSNRVPQ